MNRRISLLGALLLSLAVPALADSIYKWEDENGQVHFSDVPREGAQEVDIAPAQTFSASDAARKPRSADNADGKAEEEEFSGYDSLEIVSPSQEETIWNTGGQVSVRVSVSPQLQPDHRIRLFMDGQLLADLPPRATSVQLSEVVRGAHNLNAEVQDENGKTLTRSSGVTFFYQQTSVNRRPGVR